ncbi:hypothetical protein HU200_011454 [Digitaria exilis]|uniref:Uncharacterized protein n=1 Tax=Digitaria exilis TaxID=1010633 RepID=A0A835FHE1_9POAL|nr:hypothetical protein HU200_014450 [Digitaria exilis]KAF8754812.1 hypothetical protein HU200_011454 [Digitaria exilis]
MARHRSLPYRASLVLLVLVGLLLSSFATATPTLECGGWGRKLLVTAPRVSPDTRSSSGSQQEMVIGGWRWATPFRRVGASLGRRVPGSHANPSHN